MRCSFSIAMSGRNSGSAKSISRALRQRGFARKAVEGLMRWGAETGASAVCLQVEASNTPAIALYRSLGFTRELYRYHYRVRD